MGTDGGMSMQAADVVPVQVRQHDLGQRADVELLVRALLLLED